MATKVLGVPGMIEQPRRYSGGPTKPDQTIRTWRGPKAAAKAMIKLCRMNLWDWELEESGPNATVTATMSNIDGSNQTPEVPVDNWELVPGEVEKDLLEADIAAANLVNDTDKKTLRNLIAQPPSLGTKIDNAWALTTFTGTNEEKAAAFEMYQVILKGQRSVKMFAPVLRRTRTVSNQYAVREANTNSGRLIKTSSLESVEQVPASFLISFGQPPFSKVPLDQVRYTYAWFKHPPTLQVAANNRIQITQQWEFGLWSILIYDDPI
jgi:hypothetical protein